MLISIISSASWTLQLSPPDSCIKMGSDDSRFNVSLIVRDKVTRECPQTTTLLKRKESRSGTESRSCLPAEAVSNRCPSAYQPNAFPLGQTGSQRRRRVGGVELNVLRCRADILGTNCDQCLIIVQELCESRGGRPGLSVLTSLLVSVAVKIYCTVLRHWSQLVPNRSTDI